ncbi:MAG: tetratricopeptide repeat protein [Myxococcota bacterium]
MYATASALFERIAPRPSAGSGPRIVLGDFACALDKAYPYALDARMLFRREWAVSRGILVGQDLLRAMAFAASGLVAACGASGSQHEPSPAPSRPVPSAAPTVTKAPEAPVSDPVVTVEEPEAVNPAPDPETEKRARAHYRSGVDLFQQGRYAQAELELKEALNLYPVMAPANLVLGKVLLIRGTAAHDQGLIDNARSMFEMARSIDPELREAELLLKLFRPPDGASAGEQALR